ncbi:(2Fe-2S)-binding protein [Pigmentiphaga sp. GD03639]|jgi:aerobic carbon-monoxide dehydrogenase small subunit|uniref:(2Fe-2S)-binding protein n=1 Tax=Pigmentiphaga daeguensis TaxID=414049 RepID=A0ABN1CA82_9BURK|nr:MULTISPECIES: (2Fe-2S)-binding protein [unclassified Pigmentiphaga]MDH2237441.1 (2Fe-2S)-binding protein [Pigmentiphaga sp. GD03639]OVZ63115.1 ferredoxin [Pigmentiphaga sp. NML030171]
MSKHLIEVTVNGEKHSAEVPARRMLSDFLRDDLNLTGTKRGCETGICGACSVLVDGEVVKSCLSLAVQANGRSITTVEGLAKGGELHPLQQSFMECGGLQCGYCTPGMLMTACHLLERNPRPTADEVREGLNGNLCRCTGYAQIVESILDASEKMRGN